MGHRTIALHREALKVGEVVRGDMYVRGGVAIRTFAGEVTSVEESGGVVRFTLRGCLDTHRPLAVFPERTYDFLSTQFVAKETDDWTVKLVLRRDTTGQTMYSVAKVVKERLDEIESRYAGEADEIRDRLKELNKDIATSRRAGRKLGRLYGV